MQIFKPSFIHKITCTLLLSVSCLVAHADPLKPALTITPSLNTTTLRVDGVTEVTYTIHNRSADNLMDIAISPASGSKVNHAEINLINNTCNKLNADQICRFGLFIKGQDQPATFTLNPRVCASNNTCVNAQPLQVVVKHTTLPARAYLASPTGNNPNTLIPLRIADKGKDSLIGGFKFDPNQEVSQAIVVSSDGAKVYLTNSGADRNNNNFVSIVDVAQNKIIANINVGYTPKNLVLSPDGTKLYVAIDESGEGGDHNHYVVVVNTQNNSVITKITTAQGKPGVYQRLVVSPDGSKVYDSLSGLSIEGLIAIDTSNNSISKKYNFTGDGLAISPDGTKLYLIKAYDGTVTVIDATGGAQIAQISGMPRAYGLAISPDGSRLYTLAIGAVTAIDTNTNKIIDTVRVQGGAGIAVTPDGSEIYVPSFAGNDVDVINAKTLQVTQVPVAAVQVSVGHFIG